MPDPRLKSYATQAVRHLAAAGSVMVARQAAAGAHSGHVPPWPGAPDPDFHATLAAVWIWARHQRLSGVEKFTAARTAAWSFLLEASARFVPDAIDSATDDEAAYDCAMVLWAIAAEHALGRVEPRRQAIADRAARVLSMHLGALEDLSGREFRDPGFLAFALVEYARVLDDRGLLASGRKFVERAFGMKAPAPFAAEPSPHGGLFDFSSTTATRILAVIAAEGNTPFVGAWLRERIASGAPDAFVSRRLDENSWNACVAWSLGRAYAIATDPIFLEGYTAILDEIERLDSDRDGALGRDRTVRVAEVMPTFYYALAVDALVTSDNASQARVEAGARVAGDEQQAPPAPGPVDEREELRSVVAQLRTNLASRGRSGLLGVSLAPAGARRAASAAVLPSSDAVAASAVASPPAPRPPPQPSVMKAPQPKPALNQEDERDPGAPRGAAGLAVVREELGDCQRCKLCSTRTNIVFGVGNPDANLVFVGEAPGADEDAQGEPFVGRAGQLLTKMIEAMGYARDDVYICNVLKCRPPGNRNPEPDEVASCEPFLKKQLGAIRPRMIVALGKFAVQCLLRDDAPIGRLRGNLRSYEGIPLMPTFHPAYLLRDPSKKKLAWDDLKAVNAALAEVGISPPRPPAA